MKNVKFDTFTNKEVLNTGWNILNGKIVAECDFEVEKIDFNSERFYENDKLNYRKELRKQKELLKASCLGLFQIYFYLDKKGLGETNLNGYAIHIKNLHIFDKPRELKYYGYTDDKGHYHYANAPQNMMRCYDYSGIDYILISIRPEWLVKILNGEKTVDIRKKILKGMIKK